MTPQPARAALAAATATVIALGRLAAVMYCTSYLRCGQPSSQSLKAHISQRFSAEIDSRLAGLRESLVISGLLALFRRQHRP